MQSFKILNASNTIYIYIMKSSYPYFKSHKQLMTLLRTPSSILHIEKKVRGWSCWTAYYDFICLLILMTHKVNRVGFQQQIDFKQRKLEITAVKTNGLWLKNISYIIIFNILYLIIPVGKLSLQLFLFFVDTAESCDIIFRGRAFASIS